MMKSLVIVSGLLLVGVAAFGQSKPVHKTAEEPKPAMMECPMMGMMSKMPAGQMSGDRNQMMQSMTQRMAGMFALSAEEIGTLLADRKAALGLSDAQVKQVADLIASFQQQKAVEKTQRMMGQMESGDMKCPCMKSSRSEASKTTGVPKD